MLRTVWSEKYRPKELKNIVGQDDLVAELSAIVDDGRPAQHYIFHSQKAGTGKTSVARAFAKAMDYTIHEYNASTKALRGMEFVENDLIPLTTSGWVSVILLDEADQITPAAQAAMKGVMENSDAIFILTCNDISKISPWIQSRCCIRHFDELKESDMFDILSQIATWEMFECKTEYLKRIVKANIGDLRKAINALQALSCVREEERDRYTLAMVDNNINIEFFLRLCFRDKDVETAVANLGDFEIRKTVREIFDYAIHSQSSAESKMIVTEAAIIAERDCINGVQENIIRWAFCCMLCKGFIGTWDSGQSTIER